MAIEKAPKYDFVELEADLDKWNHTGLGFDDLGDALSTRVSAFFRSLQEQRQLYIITSLSDLPPSITDILKMMVVDRLNLSGQESDSVISLPYDEFDDELARRLIEDRPRPVILPLRIKAPGDQVAWWMGRIWSAPSPGNIEVIRNQLKQP